MNEETKNAICFTTGLITLISIISLGMTNIYSIVGSIATVLQISATLTN